MLMQNGNLRHDVAPHEVSRWESFGYVLIDAPQADSGKEVAGEVSSPVAPTVAPTPKRKNTRKKVAQDDKS